MPNCLGLGTLVRASTGTLRGYINSLGWRVSHEGRGLEGVDRGETAYFCLKYNRPLAMTARPDDARTGRRRNCTALLVMLPMLHDGGGGGESDMMTCSRLCRWEGRCCGGRTRTISLLRYSFQ